MTYLIHLLKDIQMITQKVINLKYKYILKITQIIAL